MTLPAQHPPTASLRHEAVSREDLGIYLHIPFCLSKCPYCDFNSVATSSWPEEEYVIALLAELTTYAHKQRFAKFCVRSVYFGGGTPSLFQPRSFEKILSTIASLWSLCADAEVTLEANPGTVDLARLQGFLASGVNRLSLGVQSFSAPTLQRLGRTHTGRDAIAAVVAAQRVGFRNLNVDLIFAVPGQSPSDWERDLQQACALGPTHISAYNLTYEDGTPFAQWRRTGRLLPVDEDAEMEMFLTTESILREHGYERYEMSNFALPGFACRHNLGYWRSLPYVGLGAGAHGFTPAPGRPHWGVRWSNVRSPARFMASVRIRGHGRTLVEKLDRRRAAGEFVFLALRCTEGIDRMAFARRFGASLEEEFATLARLAAEGLLEQTPRGWKLSDRGFLLADTVFTEFV